LIVLLLSALVDDGFAAATVDTDDDLLAAENNLYLHGTAMCPQQHSGKADLPLPGAPYAAAFNDPTSVTALGPSANAEPASLAGQPLLYLFMSLRR
jgi:hypothetical protein